MAEGYGPTERAARDDSLGSLASNIFVEIESSAESYQSDQGGSYFHTTTRSRTNLPLVGVEFDCTEEREAWHCSAVLEPENALPVYREKLHHLRSEIDVQTERLANESDENLYARITSVLALYDDFEKYRTIVTFLQGKAESIRSPTMTRMELRGRLAAQEKRVASLELAAELLARGISQQAIYVQPATSVGSTEVTPFANALAAQLRRHVNTTSDLQSAKYFLSGSYQIHRSGIQVSYALIDGSSSTLHVNVVELAPESYHDYRAKPQAVDFDTLLHQGYVVSNDMRVELSSDKGRSQLSFGGGEMVELFVKLNRPAYFYIVGHIKNTESGELSYLLDSNETAAERRFVRYVNADDANKWMSLGKFEVAPPYGVESLQVVASAKDLVDSLPPHKYDAVTGYHVVAKNLEEGVERVRLTRGLQRPGTATPEGAAAVESAEAVVLFTTHARLAE
jgi:hypothetical protein